MRLTLHFECSGCEEKVDVEAKVERVFRSFSGRSYGVGTEHTEWPKISEVTPEGWIAFDPYTHITYCPACWAEILEVVDV